ncbi:MAG: threonine synthase [Anaerolineaceae bacterium]|nr:threonine synthase [Anaerolineaceae bacterium]
MREDFIGYRCSVCGEEYEPKDILYTCPKDGGNLDVILDYRSIQAKTLTSTICGSREESLWRYLPLLPVSDPGGYETPLRAAGWTKTYRPIRLAEELGLEHLWIKDESRNPTASFKDRASAILVARAQEIGAEVIVTASTGNAGAALAGMAAAVDREAVIFAPKTAPPAKIAQLLVFGAKVILVDGTYDEAFDLAVEASNKFGWYCRNTGYNPFTAEGKKTASFEIWEQVLLKNSQLKAPLNVFVSVGDGNIISGLHKGFKDLLALGWIEEIPRLFGIQSTGSSAIANAYFDKTEDIKAVSATTLADSISVDLPRDGLRALRAATQTGGAYIRVEDEDILKAIPELGKVGIFAEPAGATAYAGLQKALAEKIINPEDPVLVLNTGSGLKDVKAAATAVGEAPIIEPSMKALENYLKHE